VTIGSGYGELEGNGCVTWCWFVVDRQGILSMFCYAVG